MADGNCPVVHTGPNKFLKTEGFWDRHEREMRKARLLQAAATIFAHKNMKHSNAVQWAFILENDVAKQLRKEEETSGHS